MNICPDIVPGEPIYVVGAQFPGGRRLNSSAFSDPPAVPGTGQPARQGNLRRNQLRGFGATQWDFALHRDFPIRELLKLQFRAEMFNFLTRPNFAPPYQLFGSQRLRIGQGRLLMKGCPMEQAGLVVSTPCTKSEVPDLCNSLLSSCFEANAGKNRGSPLKVRFDLVLLEDKGWMQAKCKVECWFVFSLFS